MDTPKITMRDVLDGRFSETLDVDKEPDLYLAKVAWEYHGSAIRDNTIEQMISIGRDIEAGDDS